MDNLLKIIVMEVGTLMCTCMSGHPYICAVYTIISSSFMLYLHLLVSINYHTSARISQARHLIEGHRCFAGCLQSLDWTTGLTFDLKLSHKNGNIVKAECVLGLAGDEGQSWSVHACTLVKTRLK